MINDLIIGDRGTGKTSKLIRISAAEGKYIVVPTERMKQSVACQAKEMGLNILFPVCLAELPFHGQFRGEVLVDEPQMLLERIIGAPISAMTACARDTTFCCRDGDGGGPVMGSRPRGNPADW